MANDPTIGTARISAVAHDIPRFTANPKVSRIVRLPLVLTEMINTITPTYNDISMADGKYYGVITLPPVRYLTMRVSAVRVYMDVGNAQQGSTYGLAVTETLSVITYSDIPASGISIAAVGMLFSFRTRSSIVPVGTVTPLCSITTTTPIPVGPTNMVNVYADFTVEFQ